MTTWTCKRNEYCDGCCWWRYFGNHYGCWKFKTYKLDDFDRLCGGRWKNK